MSKYADTTCGAPAFHPLGSGASVDSRAVEGDGHVAAVEARVLAETDPAKAREAARAMCDKLLANTVIENYTVDLA